jgi:peptidoglycan/xylan/chitin deacetylase (PgdA/CDA1 family)
MDYLDRNGFRVWSLQRIATRLRNGQPIPDKTVAITFDDTHPSIYTKAYPSLLARGWPFTVFVSPDRVDQIPAGNITWEQMREMKKNGVSFANHSSNHLRMPRRHRGFSTKAWNQYLLDNVLNAQARLQEELGSDTNEDPRLFSYPYGEMNADLMDILKSAGFIAFGQHPGAIGQYHNRQALPRFLMMNHNTSMETFARKANSVALNIRSISPANPMTYLAQPSVSIKLHNNRVRPRYLTCYTREGYRLNVKWHDKEHSGFGLQISHPLSRGFTYYQCTGRYQKSERTFWFSHPLVVLHNRSSTPEKPKDTDEEKEGEVTAPPDTSGNESGMNTDESSEAETDESAEEEAKTTE